MSTGPGVEREIWAAESESVLSPSAYRGKLLHRSAAAITTEVLGLPALSFGEFVQFRFVPEYVASRSHSVQSHFFAILKYVLTPERVAEAFGVDGNDSKRSLRVHTQRPYMDALPLEAISAEIVKDLMSEYLRLGYAGQTVAHIRNALRSIFGFAASCGCHSGANPATDVPVPNISRKELHRLALSDIKAMIPLMRYPEREIALMMLITGLQVTEICGLQLKHVNLSNSARMVDGELVPPRTLAVRNQSYRGALGPVNERRRQIVSIGGVLTSVLRGLLNRERFINSEDFLLCTRNGTRINPDNIALRRLKPIGMSLQMPWLSWKVFRNSRGSLAATLGRLWSEQLAESLSLKRP
jgi:site-specific recombinase XerC